MRSQFVLLVLGVAMVFVGPATTTFASDCHELTAMEQQERLIEQIVQLGGSDAGIREIIERIPLLQKISGLQGSALSKAALRELTKKLNLDEIAQIKKEISFGSFEGTVVVFDEQTMPKFAVRTNHIVLDLDISTFGIRDPGLQRGDRIALRGLFLGQSDAIKVTAIVKGSKSQIGKESVLEKIIRLACVERVDRLRPGVFYAVISDNGRRNNCFGQISEIEGALVLDSTPGTVHFSAQ